jgi:hypothetical protein
MSIVTPVTPGTACNCRSTLLAHSGQLIPNTTSVALKPVMPSRDALWVGATRFPAASRPAPAPD